MKLRCLLGLHGPIWTSNPEFIGPYSQRIEGVRRLCPHCQAAWGGIMGTRQGYRAIVAWERLASKDSP